MLGDQDQNLRLSRLLATLEALSLGRYEARCLLSSRQDWIDAIAHAVNALAEELEVTIAARDSAHATLHQREMRYRGLFGNTLVPIALVSADLTVIDCNRTAAAVVDLRPEEVIGRPVGELVPDLADVYGDRVARIIASGAAEVHEDHFLVDGEPRWTMSVWQPITDAQGRATAIQVTGQEVSAIKRNEADLERALARAEAGSRAKSAFLASMSHELRTPLTAIIGFSDLLATATFGPLTQRQAEYIDEINLAGSTLLRLINEILDLSVIESGTFTLSCHPFDPSVLVTKAVESVMPSAQQRAVRFDLDLGQPLPTVRWDGQRICQLLRNLLDNAVKFSASGADVVVQVRAVGERIRLLVRDTGIGIAPNDLDKLFQPFERLDGGLNSAAGTGLGLALVHRLAQLHGGDVSVQSQLGGGTTVIVDLPITAPTGE